MKIPALFGKYFIGILLLSGCKSDIEEARGLECVPGVVVGSKCGAFAVQVDKNHKIPSKTWPKLVIKVEQYAYQDIENVIGVLNLPEELQQDGTRVFLRLRKATEEESVIPCYTDMPPVPSPVYIVLEAGKMKCPGD